jgi:hypothetical protein
VRLAVLLILAPLPVGALAGLLAHTLLDLAELWRLDRAWPGGIPADQVPEHLARHVRPVPPTDRTAAGPATFR